MAQQTVEEIPTEFIPKKTKKLCTGLRRDLKLCLLRTECVLKDKKLPKTCLREGNVPEKCQSLAYEFFECKRQWIDMRKRFRGNRGY